MDHNLQWNKRRQGGRGQVGLCGPPCCCISHLPPSSSTAARHGLVPVYFRAALFLVACSTQVLLADQAGLLQPDPTGGELNTLSSLIALLTHIPLSACSYVIHLLFVQLSAEPKAVPANGSKSDYLPTHPLALTARFFLSSLADSTSSLPNGKPAPAQPAAGSARTTSPKQSKSKKRKQRGFWASLKAALVPCASPSSAHPIEVDAAPSEPASIPLADREKEKEKPATAAPVSEKLAVPPTESHAVDPTSSSATSTTVAPEPHKPAIAPLVAIPVPPSPPSDPEEIVPPSPKPQLLSHEETGGMMSGAVQAPGSGPHETTESEGGTSFTEDEDMGKDMEDQDAEDDEERLIREGGTGIPIGPVSRNHRVRIRRSLIFCLMPSGWPAKAASSSPCLVSHWTQVLGVGS